MARNRPRRSAGRSQARSPRPLPARGDGAGRPPIEDEPLVDFDDDGEDDGVTAAAAAFGPLETSPAAERARAPRAPLGARTANFLRGCWAELRRVQWPDRPQVVQATSVVLGFVVLTGAFLGIADFVAGKLINAII